MDASNREVCETTENIVGNSITGGRRGLPSPELAAFLELIGLELARAWVETQKTEQLQNKLDKEVR